MSYTTGLSREDFVHLLQSDTRLKDDSIVVKRVYIDMAGDIVTGVLLSQIAYWHGNAKNNQSRMKVERDGYLWIARKIEDLWEDCRLSVKQGRTALKKLKEKNLITTKIYKFSGNTCTHIRLNFEYFIPHLHDHLNQTITTEKKRRSNTNAPVELPKIDMPAKGHTDINQQGHTESPQMGHSPLHQMGHALNNINNTTENTTKNTTKKQQIEELAYYIDKKCREIAASKLATNISQWCIDLAQLAEDIPLQEIKLMFDVANQDRTPRNESGFCWAKVITSPKKLIQNSQQGKAFILFYAENKAKTQLKMQKMQKLRPSLPQAQPNPSLSSVQQKLREEIQQQEHIIYKNQINGGRGRQAKRCF